MGQSPQQGPGAEPWSGIRGVKPPETESFFVLGCITEGENLPILCILPKILGG